jgi:hypothetical protein
VKIDPKRKLSRLREGVTCADAESYFSIRDRRLSRCGRWPWLAAPPGPSIREPRASAGGIREGRLDCLKSLGLDSGPRELADALLILAKISDNASLASAGGERGRMVFASPKPTFGIAAVGGFGTFTANTP